MQYLQVSARRHQKLSTRSSIDLKNSLYLGFAAMLLAIPLTLTGAPLLPAPWLQIVAPVTALTLIFGIRYSPRIVRWVALSYSSHRLHRTHRSDPS